MLLRSVVCETCCIISLKFSTFNRAPLDLVSIILYLSIASIVTGTLSFVSILSALNSLTFSRISTTIILSANGMVLYPCIQMYEHLYTKNGGLYTNPHSQVQFIYKLAYKFQNRA